MDETVKNPAQLRRERLLDDCGIQVLYRPEGEEKNGGKRV